jgi:RNA polymerase sigma-70 factor, ECF subfamily
LSTERPSAGQSSALNVETSLADPVEVPPLAPAATLDLPPFDALYDEYFALVWRTAHRLGVPESELDDVVQDVFLVVHRRLSSFDGRVAFRHWLLGIVARVVAGHRRTYRRKESKNVPHAVDRHGAEATPSPSPAPSDQAEQHEALRLVVTLLDELDAEKREVLVLSEFEEMTAVEISECLRLNVNTVYTRLRAGRRAFDAAHARHCARTERRPA